MDVVENTLPVPLEDFLARPLFAHLSTVAGDGAPRDAPVWFLWEDGSLWVILNTRNRTVDDRVREDARTAVGVVDFEPATGRVQHVGLRGPAEIVEHDPDRVVRLLSQYLGPDRERWDRGKFGDPDEWGEEMVLLRVDPATVVARDQSYDGSLPNDASPAVVKPATATSDRAEAVPDRPDDVTNGADDADDAVDGGR